MEHIIDIFIMTLLTVGGLAGLAVFIAVIIAVIISDEWGDDD